ncbi:uncharacterized protein EI97DRAFT_427020 [Westerdykella ornata]|uniref:Zn(2)-C6 fungal-type domain-containing protein n=1 Tax=Westerdykella ornata TaxID=318751 RepID=A0A6A6J6J7_WESOR|nr:uncharacterized protein EI97DRAFT_427020 [Westerdykella ornata]KAF2272055.1 hypothetical protein EI97DRAFT_427020 [Westerdykella ornata]
MPLTYLGNMHELPVLPQLPHNGMPYCLLYPRMKIRDGSQPRSCRIFDTKYLASSMGKLRSKHGCLTCRSRHVKCDETQPVCGQCRKGNRQCQREDPSRISIRSYRPRETRRVRLGVAHDYESGEEVYAPSRSRSYSQSEHTPRIDEAVSETSSHNGADIPDHTQAPVTLSDRAFQHVHLGSRRYSQGGQALGAAHVLANISAHDYPGVPNPSAAPLPGSTLHDGGSPSHLQHATLPTSEGSHLSPYASPTAVQVIASPPNTSIPLLPTSPVYTTSGISIPQLLHPASTSPESHHWAQSPSSTSIPATLTHHEAYLVHHYAENLGRWLDCTDASRQFTLKIPALVKTSPILLHAVLSFAARHVGDTEAAEVAHQRCLELLILLLNSENVADDELLLCAIVILRVFEQLKVMVTGSDQERHLAGCSALLRASQGSCVDPSAPTLRQAAFWVYIRQCLYNACVNQQPPNIDFNLTLMPIPAAAGTDPASDLRVETAWANNMTWICATVIQFCFGGGSAEPLARKQKWTELEEAVESWLQNRPATFDPIWAGLPVPGASNPFPEFWFIADWHVMAFGFYHLSCMLLIMYKPTPRFAVRSVHGRLRETDFQVMEHARAICGACRSSPATVPSLITLCHTVFIWGPLMTDQFERDGVIQLLVNVEKEHAWPTAWIVQSLREEWGMV